MEQTLVLDVSYQPVQRIIWQEAIVLVLKKAAFVIEDHPEKYINTVSWKVGMPSIIKLVRPNKRRKAIKFSRHGIYLRDKGRCQYCSAKLRKSEMQYEHVIPRSQGGTTCWENILMSCMPCNQKKGGRTPQQAGMRQLSVPVRPKSLPSSQEGLGFSSGMPESWKVWLEDGLRDMAYWHVELEQ